MSNDSTSATPAQASTPAPAPPQKRNASERLDDIEHAISVFFKNFNNLAADLQAVKEAVKLLGNKGDSIVKALSRGGPVNDDTISSIMIENNIETLKDSVTKLIDQGALVPSAEADMSAFIVAQEVNDAGAVVQPRTQFAIAALPTEIQLKILGAKVGDVLTIQEGKLKLSILEIYSIVQPVEPAKV